MAINRIAVIGSGVAGLTSALLLQEKYRVTLYEKNNYFGGHTHTLDVEENGVVYPVNTGFIVFNDWTYPNFIKLMQHLGVEDEHSDMSFSVRCDKSGLEYNGTNLNSLFCQRSNVFKPRFWRMIKDILHFNKEATEQYKSNRLDPTQTLEEYLKHHRYSENFKNHYIVPMGAAIWSASEADILHFPIHFFVRFFHNHGMLSVDERPQWRVLKNGSRSYVQKIKERLVGNCHLNSQIHSIQRENNKVTLIHEDGKQESYDAVVMACHSDQALGLLNKPTPSELDILGAIPYQDNSVVLHTDTSLLPKHKLGWAAWNYRIPETPEQSVSVTYNMSILQNFNCEKTFCVSLNQDHLIDPKTIIAKYNYSHPCFQLPGTTAQQQFHHINGKQNTYFCGAYWANGFHEDGVVSAIRVAKSLGVDFEEVLQGWKAPCLKAS